MMAAPTLGRSRSAQVLLRSTLLVLSTTDVAYGFRPTAYGFRAAARRTAATTARAAAAASAPEVLGSPGGARGWISDRVSEALEEAFEYVRREKGAAALLPLHNGTYCCADSARSPTAATSTQCSYSLRSH